MELEVLNLNISTNVALAHNYFISAIHFFEPVISY